MLHIYIDADACPVKNEVYRVADREGLEVTLVSNSPMRIPEAPTVSFEVVGGERYIRVEDADVVVRRTGKERMAGVKRLDLRPKRFDR